MGDIADVLHVVVRGRGIWLLLRVPRVNALQNANAATRESPQEPSYRKSFSVRSNLRIACALLMYITASPAYPFFCFLPKTSSLRLLFLLIALLLIDFCFGFPATRLPIAKNRWIRNEKTPAEGRRSNGYFKISAPLITRLSQDDSSCRSPGIALLCR